MRQNLCHPVRYGIIISSLQHLRPEARSIHAEHPDNSLLNIRSAIHGTVHGEIPALGMSSDIKRAVNPFRYRVQISHTVFLSGHRRTECHVKVFLPSDNCLVSAAKRDINRPVIQYIGDCRKLHLRLFLHHIDITVQLQIAVSFSRQHSLNQRTVDFLVTHIRKQVLVIRVRLQALQRDGRKIFPDSRHHSVKFQIGELAQCQTVNLRHRHFPKRIFPVFFYIIQNGSHTTLASRIIP